MDFEKHEPKVATRVRAFWFKAQVSEDDIPAAGAKPERTRLEEDDEGEMVEVVIEEAAPAVTAHIVESYNYTMGYNIFDQDSKVIDQVREDFTQHLTTKELNQLKAILDKCFQQAKDSIT